ncbi:MAG: LacI family DNA-binding transcriptional regulator [Tannerellaceae bacterium]|jgi:LacI family transcriptional regulator|nr:LacI family DNA-binding transcriptional regulator [Tannerellaceae bacterium]
MKTYRIKDIADMSGVSTGTVDRILHKRGRVSIEAQEKVAKVLKEIDYQPNLIARSLALKKKYNLIVLTPQPAKGEYWAKLAEGVGRAEKELFSYHVNVKRLCFDQYNKNSFDAIIPLVALSECHGVVIATLFRESVMELAVALDAAGIPYVLIDAYIEGTNCVAYYGTHSYDSGYIAGRLMLGQIRRDDDIAVFYFNRKSEYKSTQVSKREEGFCDYVRHHRHEGRICTVEINADGDGDGDSNNEAVLDDFFDKNPNLKAGIIFNSRASLLCNYLVKRNGMEDFKLIGYDVLDGNVGFLRSGLITHLIAQRPEVQGLHAVKALFRHLVMKEDIEQVNYMPIDVLMKENIAYYNNYI